ncbi:MAG TPA: hypothetical protein VKQ28_12325 [Candidatus Acidoferrum sp.]|nr:hypothetical protein [Candidatus Acidoferrum sp.]
MKCEEFEAIGLERDGQVMGELESALREAAMQHAARCPGCAALQESWQEARLALAALRDNTRDAEAPQRLEVRLRHEFGMRHRTERLRSTAIFGAWALATAAMVFAGLSWWNWKLGQTSRTDPSSRNTVNSSAAVPVTDPSEDTTLVADNGDFTLLPGSLPQEVDDSSIVRVGMQRGALTALGLPVNEESVNDYIQVDLLVGPDGLPKAVRLPQSQ